MSFTGAFTVTKNTATGLNAFTVTDTSSYADEAKVTFSGRKVYCVFNDGTYLEDESGNDYFDFPFAGGDALLIEALTDLEIDAALNVYVVWTSIAPVEGSTYTDSQVFDFVDLLRTFMYTMIENTANSRLLNWPNGFYEGMSLMQTFIDTSANCILNNDQYASQQAIDLGTTFSSNLNNFY